MSLPTPLADSLISFPSSLEINASAPCRVNCGGTWDMPAFSLPFEWLDPTTVNIALELRTSVRLTSYKEGRILIISKGFATEEFSASDLPFDSKLGLVTAIVSHFGVQGLRVEIESSSPPRSGLGGSGTLAVALIAALDELMSTLGFRRRSRQEVVWLSHAIENSVGISLTGLQDQAAAVYGGVNQWTWRYSRMSSPLQRRVLLPPQRAKALENHLLVAFTGQEHDSSHINQKWLRDFLSGSRDAWYEIHVLTNEFASAIGVGDWRTAAELLMRESDLRAEITPEMVPPYAATLIKDAKELLCGTRFAGAGGGGCLWAIGEIDKINLLATRWMNKLSSTEGYLLPNAVSSHGVIVESNPRD